MLHGFKRSWHDNLEYKPWHNTNHLFIWLATMIQSHPLPKKTIQLPKQAVSKLSNPVLNLATPKIMGILNVTPDSFSDGGQHHQIDTALAHAERMLKEGVDIIDIGGESTRPQAQAVILAEEKRRVLPVVEAIAQRFDVMISVDTSSPDLMQAANLAGAHIWNDVRSLRRPNAKQMAADLDIPVILMHMRGEPHNMMQMTHYDDVVADVKQELTQILTNVVNAGVKKDNIILDVGFGFAKNTEQNLILLKQLADFHDLGLPLMIGLSRKRMLAEVVAKYGTQADKVNDISCRIPAGMTANMLAVMQGVSIIRTHDVANTVNGLATLSALHEL